MGKTVPILRSMQDHINDVQVDKPILLVGRAECCDIILVSKKISRLHCCIAQLKNALTIRDLGSTNGIQVNEQHLDEAKVYHDDRVRIGNLDFKLNWMDAANPNGNPSNMDSDHNSELDQTHRTVTGDVENVETEGTLGGDFADFDY